MDSKNKYEGGAGYFCESSLAEEVSLDVRVAAKIGLREAILRSYT